MKDWNIGKWIKRFIILIGLFIGYDSIMNSLDQMYEVILENKPTINENIDTNSFLTMHELGFEYHETTNSKVEKLNIHIDPDGYMYNLEINNDDSNHYLSLDLTFYKFSSTENARLSFEVLASIMYENNNKPIQCYIGTCVSPRVDFETAVQHLSTIDLNVWDVDEGYALNELFLKEVNQIILLKEDQILLLKYNNGSLLNESHIPTFVNLFEKTEEIYNSYEGE